MKGRHLQRYWEIIARVLAGMFLCVLSFVSNAQELPGSTVQTLSYRVADTAAIQQILRDYKKNNYTPDSAIKMLRWALEKSQKTGYNAGVAKLLLYLGDAYIKTGAYDKSLVALQNGIRYCEKTEEGKRTMAALFDMISTVYQMKGDYEEAARYLYRAAVFMEYFPSAGLRLNYIYNNLSALLFRMEQFDKALYYLDKAQQHSEGNNDLIATIQLNRGIIYARRHHWDTAMFYLGNGLYIARMYHLEQTQHNLLMNIGSMYLARKRPDSALAYLLQSRSLDSNINPYYANGMVLAIGETYYSLHQYPVAEQYLKNALATATKLRLNNDLMDAHRLLSYLYDHTNKYKEAMEHYVAYMALKDSVENKESIKNINQLEVRYASAQKDKELMRKQLLITEQEKYLQRKNMWLVGTALGAVVLTILLIVLYRLYVHRQRLQVNRIHILQQEQEIMQLKAMMNGEEKERTRIAQELHDGIGGMLAAIKMNFSAVQKRYEELNQINELSQIMDMVEDTTGEVRKTAHNLMPNVLLRHDLANALHIYCESINMGDGPHIELQLLGAIGQLEKAVELILYRIIQELIQNVIKHANATHVEIEISQRDNDLSITVEDDGVGFDVNEQNGGYGLQNLRYRVQALQGHISIESAKGFGTTMFINFDITKLQNIFTA